MEEKEEKKQRHHHRPPQKVCYFGRRQKDDGFFFSLTRRDQKKKKKKKGGGGRLRPIIIIFTNALFKKKKHTLCVCVGVLVGIGVSGVVVVPENNAAIQEQLFERRRRKKKKKKRVLLFSFLVVTRKFPREHALSCGKKMTTDRKYVRARGGGGLEHRFSFICVSSSMSRGEDRRQRFSVLRVSFPRFFVFPRDAFLRGKESAIASELVAVILSLSFSLSLSYRAALYRNDDRMVSMTDHL